MEIIDLKVKEEFERVQKRLDVMIALMDDSMETKKQERELKMNEVVEQIEEKFEQLKALSDKMSYHNSSLKAAVLLLPLPVSDLCSKYDLWRSQPR